MGKIKVNSKNGNYCCTIKMSKSERINPQMANGFLSRKVDGFIPFVITPDKDSYEIVYSARGFISLREFLKKPIGQREFYLLLDSIVGTLSKLGENAIEYGSVMMELDTIAIECNTNKVYFLYYPIIGYNNNKYFNVLLDEVVKKMKPSKGTNTRYIEELQKLLANPTYMSWESLKHYISTIAVQMNNAENLLTQRNVYSTQNTPVMTQTMSDCHNIVKTQSGVLNEKVCRVCGFNNKSYSRFCVKCGNIVEDGVSQTLNYMNNYTDERVGNCGEDEVEGTTILFSENDSEGATTMLTQDYNSNRKYPYVVRLATNEKVSIDRDVFTIGKSQTCNYVINNNNTVSRNHINIIYDNGLYYLVDMNSTNHTYINGQMVQPNMRILLEDGMTILLSNEEFRFNL
ncbi:MAG: FHA domain-containing protein [Eubacterium sp.]